MKHIFFLKKTFEKDTCTERRQACVGKTEKNLPACRKISISLKSMSELIQIIEFPTNQIVKMPLNSIFRKKGQMITPAQYS